MLYSEIHFEWQSMLVLHLRPGEYIFIWIIIFCLRYVTWQERFQLPQVMIFSPRTQVNVFCMMNMSRVYYCPQFVLFNYLTNITESLLNDTSLIETSIS